MHLRISISVDGTMCRLGQRPFGYPERNVSSRPLHGRGKSLGSMWCRAPAPTLADIAMREIFQGWGVSWVLNIYCIYIHECVQRHIQQE